MTKVEIAVPIKAKARMLPMLSKNFRWIKRKNEKNLKTWLDYKLIAKILHVSY